MAHIARSRLLRQSTTSISGTHTTAHMRFALAGCSEVPDCGEEQIKDFTL